MTEKNELTKKEDRSWDIWDPLQRMRGLQHTMSHLFEDIFNGGHWRDLRLDMEGGRSNWFPAVNIEETDKEYVFKADVPGLEKEDVKVEVDKGLLKIQGERKEKKEEKGKGFIRKEQYYCSFNRTFALPNDAKTDDVKAEYKNGILTVRLTRAEELKPKSVKINVQ